MHLFVFVRFLNRRPGKAGRK